MNSESAGHREQPDVPGTPNAPSTRPRAFHRRRRTDGPAFTRPDQYLGQSLYPLRAAFADPAEATAPPATAAAAPFERLSSIEGLAGAWQMVLVRDARDGLLQRQTRLIAGDLDRFLAELSASLREGTYLPAPLLRADIPKRTPGQTRVLHIPAIRDRVVERAVVNTIAHDADRIMSPCSFAYRTGIGADDAVHHLATLRDDGYRHVLRTDVEDYFPNLDVEDALTVLAPVVGCPRTIDLIRLIARPRRARGERRTRSRGIAQGSCLSPLLANLVLNDADHALNDAGYGYARFADDIVVCAPARDDLLAARELLDSLVAAHGLNLNEEKTAMTTFDEGFCFLGVDFSRTRPAVDPHHDIKGAPNPDEVVYVGRDGARVHVSKGRLIVSGADELPLVSIPRRAVSRIVLTGAVGLSAGARSWALRNDVDVIFLSRHGGYLGRLSAPRDTANARRLLTQAAFAADNGARACRSPGPLSGPRCTTRSASCTAPAGATAAPTSSPRRPARLHGQAPQPVAGPHGGVPAPARGPHRHGAAPLAAPAARARHRLRRRRGGVAGQGRQEGARRRLRGHAPAPGQGRPAGFRRHLAAPHTPPGPTARSGHCRARLQVERRVMALTVVLAYDIAADSRRTRLAAALEGWGYRIQESVFSLRLEDDELGQVRTCVDEIIDADDDVVHIYPLCAACLARGEVHGTAPDLDDGGLYRGVW